MLQVLGSCVVLRDELCGVAGVIAAGSCAALQITVVLQVQAVLQDLRRRHVQAVAVRAAARVSAARTLQEVSPCSRQRRCCVGRDRALRRGATPVMVMLQAQKAVLRRRMQMARNGALQSRPRRASGQSGYSYVSWAV